jgi:hypothetical protein
MFAEYSLNKCQGITNYELQERISFAISVGWFLQEGLAGAI